MKVFNVSLVFLCVFQVISAMVVMKGPGAILQNEENGATTSIPEPSNVRGEKPETDVAKPQLPKEEEPFLDSPLIKRCARSEIVGSHQAPLSIARRDLTGRRVQQCEACKNGKLCKEHNMCSHCKALCKDLPTTPSPIEPTSSAEELTPPQEKREVASAPVPETPGGDVVLGSRFGENGDDGKTIPRYYSVGAVESEPATRLFTKIFNIPNAFEKFIVLGKMKGTAEGADFNNIIIIDLAQVFGTAKKTQVTLHRFENSDPNNVRLVNQLNQKLDEILSEKKKTGEQLGAGEIDEVIDEAMKEVSNSVGSPQEKTESERCNIDEAVEDLIAVLPADMAERAKTTLHHDKPQEKPQPQYEESAESYEEEIKNPPVIQDNYNVGEPLKKDDLVNDYVDDTGESKGVVPETSSRLQDAKDHTNDNVVREVEPENVRSAAKEEVPENIVEDTNRSVPPSENQIVGKPADPANDLERNVLKIVEDSLKAAGGENLLREETPRSSQANMEDMQTAMKEPLVEAPAPAEEVQAPVAEAPDNVGAPHVALEPRSQFEDGKQSNYFGSLVPSKDLSGVTDPRMKKVLYVGENMNLPLKMYQDTDGVIKLRVDTDALCNCKNTTCTKKHVDERFRSAVTEEQESELPPLQVRFERNQRSNLMDNFMDDLHNHDENLGIFKRSATSGEDSEGVESEKMELENEIVKLSENLEHYKNANKELINKGTVALFKDVEKTRDVDRMITLANNFLVWMKELAMKHLDA